MNILENWRTIQDNIRKACIKSNRNVRDVQVIAVTKYVHVPRIEEALKAGIAHIGENKAQDVVEKWGAMHKKGTWHFIGHLQSNKVKDIIDKCQYIHSLDRFSLAKEIQKRASRLGIVTPCFVQVNVSGEKTKHGLAPEEVEDFIAELGRYSQIEVVGLMTMAPHVPDAEEIRPVFRELRELQLTLQTRNWTHAPLTELSMGMSNDYQVAVEEGATYLRLGACLVGKEK